MGGIHARRVRQNLEKPGLERAGLCMAASLNVQKKLSLVHLRKCTLGEVRQESVHSSGCWGPGITLGQEQRARTEVTCIVRTLAASDADLAHRSFVCFHC